jgi:uncharacterized coiled-coil DUF342 family protein
MRKAIEQEIRGYMEGMDWDDEEEWNWNEIAYQSEKVEAAIIRDMKKIGIIDEDSDEYHEEFSRRAEEAERIANAILTAKLKEYKAGMKALRKQITG